MSHLKEGNKWQCTRIFRTKLWGNKDYRYVALFGVNLSIVCHHYSFQKDPTWEAGESTTLSCPLNQNTLKKIACEYIFPCNFQQRPRTYVKYRDGQRHPDKGSFLFKWSDSDRQGGPAPPEYVRKMVLKAFWKRDRWHILLLLHAEVLFLSLFTSLFWRHNQCTHELE